ncbi:MAG TPA: lytic transglycosylase domain-containing protein [Gaiellaceae bacterium]|nr:lytic transglycosylase domain-containing protein [Gaiellaceae bacterium]
MQTPPADLAAQLVRADSALHAHVTVAQAVVEEKIELRLAANPTLSRAVIRLLPTRLARDVTDDVIAHRELTTLRPSHPGPPVRLGPALAAAKLRTYYTEAQRRSGIAWQVLAAVNFVESDFGRLREPSADGALGPMQFMPSTWAEYGRGSVHDPHQAVLAAARFLRAAGGASNERAALYRYNPAAAYVDAVERYAGRIRRDPLAFLVYYARRPILG